MKNDARTPAIVTHNNPHQIPNIAPAASAKMDSGNIIEVHRMKSEINSTGPQYPRYAISVSTETMYCSKTKWNRQKTPTSAKTATTIRIA
jgi:hypothetical protein